MQDTPEDTIVCCNKVERTYKATADAAAAAASPREHALPQEAFGLWRVYFPPVLVRPDRRLLV